MKKSKCSEQQIITLLKEVELGARVGETCREYGISEATYYKWKSQIQCLSPNNPFQPTSGSSLRSSLAAAELQR